MMNQEKFGSPHLDHPSLRYEILKFAFKSVKTNKKIFKNPIYCYVHLVHCTRGADSWGPRVNDPT
jgi:hypothetical protein